MYRGWKPRVVVVVFVVLIVFMIISISCSSFFFYEFRPPENHIHPLLTVTYNVSLPTDFLTYSVMCKQPLTTTFGKLPGGILRAFSEFSQKLYLAMFTIYPYPKQPFAMNMKFVYFWTLSILDAISFFCRFSDKSDVHAQKVITTSLISKRSLTENKN